MVISHWIARPTGGATPLILGLGVEQNRRTMHFLREISLLGQVVRRGRMGGRRGTWLLDVYGWLAARESRSAHTGCE